MPHSNLYETAASWGQRVLTTNSTATDAFAWPANLTAEPTINGANGYVDMRATTVPSTAGNENVAKTRDEIRNILITRNVADVVFTGVGAATTTFSCRIYGVREYPNLAATGTVWVHFPLIEVVATLGTCVTGNASDEKFASTITAVANSTNCTAQAWGVTAASAFTNMPGVLDLDFRGHPFLLFQFRTGGSATNMNALIASY